MGVFVPTNNLKFSYFPTSGMVKLLFTPEVKTWGHRKKICYSTSKDPEVLEISVALTAGSKL